jgi:ribosome-binding protein aMBF1 (putative translation factor)
MITNERQVRITAGKIRKLEREMARIDGKAGEGNPTLQKALVEGVRSQIQEMKEDLEAYEQIKSGEKRVLALGRLEDLPNVLMMARVAQGMSQRGLAQKLGMKEQQIQRYEATHYQSASLKRVMEVARTLGVEIQDDAVTLLPE